jgi:hypothetical protein
MSTMMAMIAAMTTLQLTGLNPLACPLGTCRRARLSASGLLAVDPELGEAPVNTSQNRQFWAAKLQVRPGEMENPSGASAAERVPKVMMANLIGARGYAKTKRGGKGGQVMPHTDLWTFTNLPGTREALVGCDVEARDGSIGKVDEATPETGRANIVVDTGPWILGRKVVIPAGTIERIDVDDKKIFVGLTKDQIKDSPEYDPDRFDEDYRMRLGTYYDPFL